MKIVNNIRPDRQTVLFSATFPRQMEALALKALDKENVVEITVSFILKIFQMVFISYPLAL